MFLTPDQLVELTGRRRASAQCRVLFGLGIPHKRRADGSPVVLTAAVDPRSLPVREEIPRGAYLRAAWSRYIAELPDEPSWQVVVRGQPLPSVSCVYLMLFEGAVRYVGQTVDLPARMREHAQWWWQALIVLPLPDWWRDDCADDWLCAMERLAMRKYSPDRNVRPAPYSFGPNGRDLVRVLRAMPANCNV